MNVGRIGPEGMESIEFLPGENLIKFFGDVDLGDVYKEDGLITGFAGEPLELAGEEEVVVEAGPGPSPPRLTFARDTVSVENVHDFSVVDPETGLPLFSTSDPEVALPEGLGVLEAEQVEVGRVQSPLHAPLLVRSDRQLAVRGAEGVTLEGRTVSLSASQDIQLSSAAGAVVLGGGLQLDTVMLPHGGRQGYPGELPQFKLCVCWPSGLLFQVAAEEAGQGGASCLARPNPCNQHHN